MKNKKINLQMFAYDFAEKLKGVNLGEEGLNQYKDYTGYNFGNKWTNFPPRDNDLCRYDIYGAWYTGDTDEIVRHWGNSSIAKRNNAFWSKRTDDGLVRMHVPLAGDICSTSSDLLFADFPDVSIPEADGEAPDARALQAYDRLKEIISEGDVHSRLLEASEACSALGGVYLKPVWDSNLAPYPILSVAQADNAIPEFQWGILKAVTFWKVIKEEEVYRDNDKEKKIYRLLERHEKGKIYNAIYCGDKDEIGVPVNMAEYPDYAHLQEEFETGYDGLLVKYIPNIKPNRLMRGSALGQSDLAGIETLLDAIDETYSSLMRDIRLARARLLVPETFLDFDETDQGSQAKFDNDQAVFVALNADPLMAKDAGISASQFAIRTEEHVSTILDMIERVVVHAGYSPQTFGLKIEGAESGTALNIRERKTYITRQKKWKHWASALEEIFQMMLFIDNVHLKNGTPYDFRPSLQLNNELSRDPNALANTIKTLSDAQALSIDTKIRMLHPDWEEEQIIAEVEAIKEENGLSPISGPDGLDNIVNGSKDPIIFPPSEEDQEEGMEEDEEPEIPQEDEDQEEVKE